MGGDGRCRAEQERSAAALCCRQPCGWSAGQPGHRARWRSLVHIWLVDRRLQAVPLPAPGVHGAGKLDDGGGGQVHIVPAGGAEARRIGPHVGVCALHCTGAGACRQDTRLQGWLCNGALLPTHKSRTQPCTAPRALDCQSTCPSSSSCVRTRQPSDMGRTMPLPCASKHP